MNFVGQFWQNLINLLNLCWPTEEPIYAPTRNEPAPNLYMERINQISNPPYTVGNVSNAEAFYMQKKRKLQPAFRLNELEALTDSSQICLQIPAFEPTEICSNTNLLISGPRDTGKTTLAQNIIRDWTASRQQSCCLFGEVSKAKPAGQERFIESNENAHHDNLPHGIKMLVITRKPNEWDSEIYTQMTIVNSSQVSTIVKSIGSFMDDWRIAQELNNYSGHALMVFDETLTPELEYYDDLYDLFKSQEITIIVINHQIKSLSNNYLKYIDYYLLAGSKLSENQIEPFELPETIVRYFEFFLAFRFLSVDVTIDTPGDYGWIDSECD